MNNEVKERDVCRESTEKEDSELKRKVSINTETKYTDVCRENIEKEEGVAIGMSIEIKDNNENK